MDLLQRRKIERDAIANIEELISHIEFAIEHQQPLTPEIRKLVGKLAETDEIEGQYACMESFLAERVDVYSELLRENAPKSLSCFVEYLNRAEPPAPHHEFLCMHLEAIARRDPDHMRTIISMPPGHAKSTYGSHYFPAWYLGKNPNHKFIQAGHSQDFVENEFGKRVRGIIDSEEFRNVVPEVKLSSASKAAGAFQLAGKLGRYLTRGVGQGISGYRANIAGVDDPYASRKDAESAAVRKEVHDWLMADFMTRLLPRSPMFIIATRWHPLDICGVLEQMTKEGKGPGWNIINLPALAEEEDDPMGRASGEPLWPDFYDLDALLQLRASLPSRDWNSLYMGKPVDEDGGTVKAEWFQRYSKRPSEIRRRVLSVDTAIKEGERSDFTVITVWEEDPQGNHYLIHVHRERLTFEPMSKKILDIAALFDVSTILVEDKGSGTQFVQFFQGKPECPWPIIAIAVPNTTKEFRFDGVTPMFEAGMVYLPLNAQWLPDYERELLQFPGGAHDDQVDATSQYLSWARKGRALGTRKLGTPIALTTHETTPQGVQDRTVGSGMSAVTMHHQDQYKGRRLGKEFSQAARYTPGARIGGISIPQLDFGPIVGNFVPDVKNPQAALLHQRRTQS